MPPSPASRSARRVRWRLARPASRSSSPAQGELEIAIAALRTGVTVDQFTAALRQNAEASIELIHLDGGASLSAADERRAVTMSLRANTTYVVANITGERPADWEIASFTVSGQANGASAPRADVTVRIADLRFSGASTLPRRGIVRFQNTGLGAALRIRDPAAARCKQPCGRGRPARQQRTPPRATRGLRVRHRASIADTRGADNYNEVRFPRRGRYAMVCFFEGHNTQGMYRFVRVR
jgi:hypothetical protein